jgi:dihydroxyacetone synthase
MSYSNALIGHASMFLYVMNHLVGYDAWTMDELQGYGDPKLNGFKTISHAHPEIEVPGIEVTTGPLGQGIANAVGLAIASKNLAANFNKPDCKVIKSRIYCMTGDGCLMEGVALESITLAGHLSLENLVLLYDNNQVTCDGPLDWINTEDINSKMRSCGWDVLDVADGKYDVKAIVAALDLSRVNSGQNGKPVFINIRTVIGVDMASAGTAKAHHGEFDSESIATSKSLAGLSPNSKYEVPHNTLDFFRERRAYGSQIQSEWNELIQKHQEQYPETAAELAIRRSPTGSLRNYASILSGMDSEIFAGLPTRESNGIILQKLWKECLSLCGGGADLVNSNKIVYSDADVFGRTNYQGRYIRNGIREHAMASVANGMAAYSPGAFLPITATFFMFYIYVRSYPSLPGLLC